MKIVIWAKQHWAFSNYCAHEHNIHIYIAIRVIYDRPYASDAFEECNWKEKNVRFVFINLFHTGWIEGGCRLPAGVQHNVGVICGITKICVIIDLIDQHIRYFPIILANSNIIIWHKTKNRHNHGNHSQRKLYIKQTITNLKESLK